jgi:hypothetical protein
MATETLRIERTNSAHEVLLPGGCALKRSQAYRETSAPGALGGVWWQQVYSLEFGSAVDESWPAIFHKFPRIRTVHGFSTGMTPLSHS